MIAIKHILSKIDYITYTGSEEVKINNVKPIDQIEEFDNAIGWFNNDNLKKIKNIKSTSVILVSEIADKFILENNNCIVVTNPRRVFQEILTEFFNTSRKPLISKTAYIDRSAKIGNNVYIGHNVIIEEDCEVGNEVTILHNTVILNGTKIGDRVNIGSNTTIGGFGFGFEKNDVGDFEPIPHLGNVLIGNDVEIGNNTCIDRAVLGNTILEDNVKVHNLVQISHGVIIRRNAIIIAKAMISGSVVIGENSWISPSATIMNKKLIGSNSLVGLGAVVLKSVDNNTVVAGNPAKFLRNI
jgi:UDP-3-O-[3-hydroxymyristoyl] glucosamine N-acyltransferase